MSTEIIGSDKWVPLMPAVLFNYKLINIGVFFPRKKKYRTNQNKSQACENKPCDHNFKLRYNETLWQTTCLYVFSVNVTISSWKKKNKKKIQKVLQKSRQ